jgi:hypothetical protein
MSAAKLVAGQSSKKFMARIAARQNLLQVLRERLVQAGQWKLQGFSFFV